MANTSADYRKDSTIEEAFRSRMQAQCDQIQQYWRSQQSNESRSLSQDQAALEWIEQHADEFARDSNDS